MRRPARGYTFVELLIAVAMSSVVLLAVYYVFIASTEQFYRQEQNIQMQEGLRFALEYIKTDLRNSGRLSVVDGTNNPSRDPGFCRPTADLTAIQLMDNTSGNNVPDILTNAPNRVTPDNLRMLVENTGSTPLLTADVNGAKVTLAAANLQSDQAARDLLNAPTRMSDTFKAGHYLYIVNPLNNESDLVPIQGIANDGGRQSINLAAPTCVNVAQCLGACRVNSVQLIEYIILADGDDATGRKTDLHRRVLDVRNDNVTQDLIIGEHVVDLQLWGTYDSRALGSNTPAIVADPDPLDDIGNWAPQPNKEVDVFNAQNRRLRAVNLLLAVRSPREDRDWIVAPGYDDDPANRIAGDRVWFDLNSDRKDGLAHVELLVSEIHTPNLYRGI
ncbi:prepilin-type N-terminal cleavage/methylation domain-containing protein [Myxococcota bacterium]|nr:prepilin-type N-terminal cleavage/methylation domain-containing protein [Myxococcota bacterium]MBU1430412.1 prepilin-type N-terminal cleavage/methylation domain-containing protein [Myxococcota bacterium]MBU1897808.1 prepilin-type N-terminal cleavage/methylation domain-containing protein [Myxococcota bacterium]